MIYWLIKRLCKAFINIYNIQTVKVINKMDFFFTSVNPTETGCETCNFKAFAENRTHDPAILMCTYMHLLKEDYTFRY